MKTLYLFQLLWDLYHVSNRFMPFHIGHLEISDNLTHEVNNIACTINSRNTIKKLFGYYFRVSSWLIYGKYF